MLKLIAFEPKVTFSRSWEIRHERGAITSVCKKEPFLWYTHLSSSLPKAVTLRVLNRV